MKLRLYRPPASRRRLASAIGNHEIVLLPRQQEPWKPSSRCAIVRLAEERDTPTSDNATHFEVRKRDVGDRAEERALLGVGDEVVAIVEAWRQIAIEEAWRAGHAPVSHGATAESEASTPVKRT